MMLQPPKIVVVGSLNVDHTLRVPHIPAPGETLTASASFTCFGGKGANQALAAARAGGDVTLIGCVGEDDFGARYIEHLRSEGIHTGAIVKAGPSTGCAFITVEDSGENSIVVSPGANHALRPLHVEEHAALIRSAAGLLLQLECPLPGVLRAIGIAAAAGVPVILNPSPLTSEFVQARVEVDTLILNAHEAASLVSMTPAEIDAEPQCARTTARCRQMIITRGGDPTLVITARGILNVVPPQVTPVDTVGTGDAFAGAYAVACASGMPLEEAIHFANAAGALATQRMGAQPSIPLREAILALMGP
jgi:ribokinase